MRRFIFTFLLLLVAAVCTMLPAFSSVSTASAASSETYALITSSNAPLLREPTETSIDNTYFVLPKTFFVLMLQSNYTESYHKVRYKDVVGYVRKNDVEQKSYTPASIYPEKVTLKINIDADTVNLRARPDSLSSESIYKIPSKTGSIEYYSTVSGTDIMASGNALWYFVKINLSSDSMVKGYIYSGYVLLESTIPTDNDTSGVVSPVQPVDPSNPSGDKAEPEKPTSPDPVKLVGIIALCVPAVAIVIIIFARPRKKKSERTEKFSS